MSRFTREEAIQILPKFALANLMRSKKFLDILFFGEGVYMDIHDRVKKIK